MEKFVTINEREAWSVFTSIIDEMYENRPIGDLDFSILIKTAPNLDFAKREVAKTGNQRAVRDFNFYLNSIQD